MRRVEFTAEAVHPETLGLLTGHTVTVSTAGATFVLPYARVRPPTPLPLAMLAFLIYMLGGAATVALASAGPWLAFAASGLTAAAVCGSARLLRVP